MIDTFVSSAGAILRPFHGRRTRLLENLSLLQQLAVLKRRLSFTKIQSADCAPQKSVRRVFFLRDLADKEGFALRSVRMASCGSMRTVPVLLRVVSLVFSLVRDAIRFILLWTRS
jgi:hypothetical protein